ncbi:MAG: hypothetical protein K9G62_00675 [Alphaproteobacteria bacterium]|nr:hypothetical protein [Alphaproteobacteria bacterium]
MSSNTFAKKPLIFNLDELADHVGEIPPSIDTKVVPANYDDNATMFKRNTVPLGRDNSGQEIFIEHWRGGHLRVGVDIHPAENSEFAKDPTCLDDYNGEGVLAYRAIDITGMINPSKNQAGFYRASCHGIDVTEKDDGLLVLFNALKDAKQNNCPFTAENTNFTFKQTIGLKND